MPGAEKSGIARRTLAACAAALIAAACSGDPEQAVRKIEAYRAKGDYAAAAIEARSALKDHPKNAAVLLASGKAFYDFGDLPNAENSLKRALEYGHPAGRVAPELGRVLLELERYSEALDALKLDGKPDPATAPELGVLRGRAYLGQRQLLEARTEFHVSQNLRPSSAARLGLAQVALVDGDRPAAERAIAEILESDPRNVDAWLLRAELLRLDGKPDAAADAYRQAIKNVPGSAALIAALAALELSRDRVDAAQSLVNQAEKISPQSPRVRFAKVLLATKQKRNEDAVKELEALLQAAPLYGPGLLLAGMVYYGEGQFDLAQNALATYVQRSPGDLGARRMLAATLLAKGQPHLAANVLAPFIATTGDLGVLAVAADAFRLMGRFREARALLQRGLKQAPQNADLRTSLALTELASGARQRAVTELEAAIALAPKDSRADEALIMVLLGQNQTDRAEQVAASLEKRLPQSASTHILKAAVLMTRKDWPRARESLDYALQLDPKNLDAVNALADVDSAEQRPDRRRERIEAILKTNPNHVGALLALARLDLAQGGQEKGIAAIRRALSEQPQSANALLLLADTQFRYGQIGEAIISARQAHELHPFDARVIAVLAQAQVAAGDKQAAIVTLSKLTALQPDVVSGYLRLAAVQLGARDTKAAAATVLAALEKAPQDEAARALLADIYLAAGEHDRVLELGAQVQKEKPDSALGYRIEGDALLARRDYARALVAYRKAAAIQVNGALLVRMHRAQSEGSGRTAEDGILRAWLEKNPADVETRFYVADLLSRTGKHREAADQYREILRRVPNSARALNELAWTLHLAGDKRALDYARQAVVLAPADAATVDTLGWILLENGNAAEGVPALLKAVDLDGNNPEIRFHLVQGLLKIGDEQRARAELRALLANNKPFPNLAEAKALAQRLGL